MSDTEQATFEEDMKAILAGEQKAPNKNLQHFADRFAATRDKHDELAKSISELEQRASQGKIELAKMMGYLENLAEDLRHMWEEANTKPAAASAS